MATSYKTLDADIIRLKQIYVRTFNNDLIPSRYVLISDGSGAAYWNSVSSISPIGFVQTTDARGSTLTSISQGGNLNVSSIGVGGLFDVYADAQQSSLVFSNAYPNVLVTSDSVPAVTRLTATTMPNAENITMSTTQSTLKLLSVGDIKLSTITDLRAVFISISSFTASGYADLSAEARAWRPYVYSTNSTSAGYATFISSIPYSTATWNWSGSFGSNLPLSTVESYPNYTSGDVYFSTVSFPMDSFLRYIHPNSTTKMFLEVNPSYMLPRLFLGTSTPYTLLKEFSTFVQYEPPLGGAAQILPTASRSEYLLSQQSNAYTSNYFNTPLKLELDTAVLTSNALVDGPNGRYTLYHRIPGAMATLVPDGCDNLIGPRGGFSNPAPTYTNATSRSNAVFLHVYNQQGAAPPMPGP